MEKILELEFDLHLIKNYQWDILENSLLHDCRNLLGNIEMGQSYQINYYEKLFRNHWNLVLCFLEEENSYEISNIL